jgi:secondary thiamine-phosphate synthase enzyme
VRQANHKFSISTRQKGLHNITHEIKLWLNQQKFYKGLLTVFIPHTSASIVIQENADPDVLHDLTKFFQQLVPEGDSDYLHSSEGPDACAYPFCPHTNPNLNSSKFRESFSWNLAGYLSIRT